MTEIKFRAWDKKTNKYHYFDLIDNTIRAEFTLDEWVKMPKEQYTGLKDKNGKEIYEGDVVKLVTWIDRDVVVIKFGRFDIGRHEYALGWYFHCKRNGCDYPFVEADRHCEVIGNICENKNLL